jgi:hypothetical protein
MSRCGVLVIAGLGIVLWPDLDGIGANFLPDKSAKVSS